MSERIAFKQACKPIDVVQSGDNLMVAPEDEARFCRASEETILNGQSRWAANAFQQSFRAEVLKPLREWCESNADRVLACFVPYPIKQECIKAYVIRRAQRFDFELSALTSGLDLWFSDRGWDCEVLQSPGRSLETMLSVFDPRESIRVYGDFTPTSSEGGS